MDLSCGFSHEKSDVIHVWWSILGISVLHLTHPECTHTAVNTHTHWEHTPGAVGSQCPGSSWGFGALLKGVVLRVERALYIHSFMPARDSNSQLLDYESDSLTTRSRLPCTCNNFNFNSTIKQKILTIFCEAEKVWKRIPGVSVSPSVCLVSSGSASVAAGQTAEISERSYT